MHPIGQGFGRVVQVAYLVEDIDAAMANWLREAGLGPWTCFRNIELDSHFDGEALKLRIHEGLAYMGDLQIQLVQSLNPAGENTPYRDHLRAGRWGVHHMAFFSDDVDADVSRARAQGFERICEMRDKAGYRYFYCQSKSMPDIWIEFLEVYPRLREIFASGIADAASWEGEDPIRNFEYADL